MKKTISTLCFVGAMTSVFAQAPSSFGAKDILLSDFETITATMVDSLWTDTTKTTAITTISPYVTIEDNPLPLENETDKVLKFVRPAGAYKGLSMRFNKSINFSETPYLQVMVYPVKDKAPLSSSVSVSLFNDKGEVISVWTTKANIPQDEWTTINLFAGKQKSSVKYNSIQITINPEDALAKAGGTEYYIDQIGFKAMGDSILPATVFYENFGGYHQGWHDGKVAGMLKQERGKSPIYTAIKGFTSGIPFKFMNADTLAVMEARVWGMSAKYEGYSNNGRVGLNSALKGAFQTGPIDVRGYSNLNLSFGFGTQTWWPWDANVANARPRIEVSVDGGAFYEIFSTSLFLQKTGERKDLGWGMLDKYEDEKFTMVEYPITAEDGTPIPAAQTVELKFSYKAGASSWVDDMWFAGKYSAPNAVKEVKQSQFVVSPNPATDFILTRGYSKVQICDLNGREVMCVTNAETANISTLQKGIYVVKASKAGSLAIGKLVKN